VGSLDDLFEQIEDQPIPGGCERCDAYQTVSTVAPGVHVMNVHHDEWCPFLRSMEAETN
jgi:hypothetical protein